MAADLRAVDAGQSHPSASAGLNRSQSEPSNNLNPVIIIFGAAVRPDGNPSGAMRSRVEAALALGQSLRDPVFMPTGAEGEAELMSDLLERAGVPRVRIRPEPTGTNTIGSALACARLLRNESGPVHVATSAYHMARSVLLLRLAGVRAKAGRWPRVPASTQGGKRWRWRLREFAAIPVDSVIVLWLRASGRL